VPPCSAWLVVIFVVLAIVFVVLGGIFYEEHVALWRWPRLRQALAFPVVFATAIVLALIGADVIGRVAGLCR
jgi:Trk-type K+ transport system membrane component